jgi:4a-hydroxytetrahydrobiopterin dehydratase
VNVLRESHCKTCNADSRPLDQATISNLLTQIDSWDLAGHVILKRFHFADYYHTMAFVNAVAWIAHNEDHHPQLTVGYDSCTVEYSTHAVGGLTENDFICASKVDALTGTTD